MGNTPGFKIALQFAVFRRGAMNDEEDEVKSNFTIRSFECKTIEIYGSSGHFVKPSILFYYDSLTVILGRVQVTGNEGGAGKGDASFSRWASGENGNISDLL